jgi:hypothetical protein
VAQAVEAHQRGRSGTLLKDLNTPAAFQSPIADLERWLLADALARRGDWASAREMAASVADRHRTAGSAPRALLVAAWAARARPTRPAPRRCSSV